MNRNMQVTESTPGPTRRKKYIDMSNKYYTSLVNKALKKHATQLAAHETNVNAHNSSPATSTLPETNPVAPVHNVELSTPVVTVAPLHNVELSTPVVTVAPLTESSLNTSTIQSLEETAAEAKNGESLSEANVIIVNTAVNEDATERFVLLDPMRTTTETAHAQAVNIAARRETEQSAKLAHNGIDPVDIKRILEYLTVTMERVEYLYQQAQSSASTVKSNKIAVLPVMPLTTLPDLEKFETLLQTDATVEKELLTMFKYSGGSKITDAVARCFEKLMTNFVAQSCSWTGKRGNYKLSTLKTMAVMKQGVRHTFPTVTDEEFERSCMYWLQHAGTRLKREKK